ncbi:exodeoxyribonuclease III [Isoptericola hypogeus]|uniref:Exodeoxyribonuclease III n=1 Tax=Isoptericola hypogeus TaxID=300179 RepID=A0ABN2IX89_9MICO
MLTVATANVNGIRAAFRRRMDTWIATRTPDVLLLQEVRAPEELTREHLDGWHVAQQVSELKGRAGVAVASRLPLHAVRVGLAAHGPAGEPEPPVDTGRWVEADVELPGGGLLTVVSAYLHSGSTGPGQEHTMAAKYAHLDKVTARLAELAVVDHPVLVAGDLNIAHRNVDIANWKGNLKNAGFLPAERAYVDRWLDEQGWADLGRAHGGEGPGPFTWWSWRGQSYVGDRGWRIDYQLANPALAPRAVKVEVDRAPTYDERWSDHAPVVATYDL